MELRQTLKADDAIIEAARSGSKFPDDRMNNLAEFIRELARIFHQPSRKLPNFYLRSFFVVLGHNKQPVSVNYS